MSTGRDGAGATPPAADPADALVYGTPRARWVLAAAVLGSGVAAIDATVVGIALPPIGRSFHASIGTLQWVVTGYSVTLAAFLLLGGALGDRYGRRRIFVIGVVWFMAASVVCGLAPTAGTLVAARVMQGVGGALLTPASLAIIEASFRPGDRSRAIGAWAALGGLATAAGPLVGGYLIAVGSWRWVFFINVPVVVAVLLVTARHVPESHDPGATGRVDALGAALTVVFLAALSYGLIEGPTSGWSSPAVAACLVVAPVALVAFLVTEGRLSRPLLPLALFAVRQFSAANAVTFVVYGALGGALFLLPVDLENVAHYTPLEAGVSLLPVTVIMLAFSSRSGRLAARIGPRLQMSVGPVVAGGGLLLMVRAATPGNYAAQVLPAVLVFGAGLAITVAPLTATALGAAAPEHAGIASAVNNVVARSAGLLAVATLPLLAGLTGSGALLPHTFAGGFRTALAIAGGTCIAGGLLAAFTISNGEPATEPRPSRALWHCALDGSPLAPEVATVSGTPRAGGSTGRGDR